MAACCWRSHAQRSNGRLFYAPGAEIEIANALSPRVERVRCTTTVFHSAHLSPFGRVRPICNTGQQDEMNRVQWSASKKTSIEHYAYAQLDALVTSRTAVLMTDCKLGIGTTE